MTSVASIRNFAIIAHIDHGKSTLADRLIQHCGGLGAREMRSQILDSMDLERERGITIKAHTVRLGHRARNGSYYVINLIDTPGHVDFSYEVSRSLAACEGSLLLVDASQGVEAQTVANAYLAIDHGHEIIPVLNKVDLASARPELVRQQIEQVTGLDASNVVEISAKNGTNIPELLESIVRHLPAPLGEPEAALKALLIDSWYDPYLGVVILTRVIDGRLRAGLRVRLMATGGTREIEKIGIFSPKPVQVEQLGPGEIGFIVTGLKDISEARVGDTITLERSPVAMPLPGFKPSVPVVFCSIFPGDQDDFGRLRDGLSKLSLNDASFHFEPQSSPALGFGFRCGFLGLLHLEIIQERLVRKFNLELVTTAPSVVYRVHQTNGDVLELHNPSDMPKPNRTSFVQEPWIKAMILLPEQYLGGILSLCESRRGEQLELTYTGQLVILVYRLPLNEVVFDFHDRVKSLSQGYASFDYQQDGYRKGQLVTISILVNGTAVDALSMVVHAAQAEARGRALCAKLKELIPRQLFKIAIQAALGGKIIARETVAPMRKDVTAKCYGGDITRKRKLWDKQKEGKKRMRQFGHVEIPHSALLETLKMGPTGSNFRKKAQAAPGGN